MRIKEPTLPSFCLTTPICCSASLSNSFGERRCSLAVVGAHVNCPVATCASEDVVGGTVCASVDLSVDHFIRLLFERCHLSQEKTIWNPGSVRSAGDYFRSPRLSCSELFGFGLATNDDDRVRQDEAVLPNTQALFLLLLFASGLPPK
ncbi:hypothetical protein BLNAU_10403 [Blattamonas nauphoetae]|uniref:Uncharacterized protein n=1 Tax=Blattamonas nauphoetae TaxID=2049346 RepID=A0ABQ9XSX2_9EUKA|nr:hypothetical protein BLNAU_10403 [Blattamonas nauphoetae]